MDVTNYAALRRLAEDVDRQGITVDILINNAAVFIDKSRTVMDESIDGLKETIEINAVAPFEWARVFMADMMKRRYGRIVHVFSEMWPFENLNS